MPAKWLKLQNSRFGGEILVSTALAPLSDDAGGDGVAAAVGSPSHLQGRSASHASPHRQAAQSKPHARQQGVATAAAPSSNASVLAEPDGEYLRLGPSGGADVFVISVFLRAAFNLTDVVAMTLGPKSTAPALYDRGFWLSYSLFGVVVRTDVFHDLAQPDFPPIRDSFRIKSCVADLAAFVAQQQSLHVYLCTYDHVLAGVEVPLASMRESELFRTCGSSAAPTRLAVGMRALVDGNFAFPSVAESSAFIDACVTLECVETAASGAVGPTLASHGLETMTNSVQSEDTAHELKDAGRPDAQQDAREHHIEEEAGDTAAKTHATMTLRVSLVQVRLSSRAVAHLAGEEGVTLELGVNAATATGAVRFCAFTKTHVMGDNDALVLRVPSLRLEDLARAQLTVRCVSSESQRMVGNAQGASLAQALESLDNDGSQTMAMPASRPLDVPIFSKGGRECIGVCSLHVALRDDSNDADNEDELHASEALCPFSLPQALAAPSSEPLHIYRVFLQLQSLRDFKEPQDFAAIAYENPFTSRGRGAYVRVWIYREASQGHSLTHGCL